jgi:hypothetical protein
MDAVEGANIEQRGTQVDREHRVCVSAEWLYNMGD